jgi:two-component system phosphate regulon sensor histidine kinase PhoR
MESSRTSYVIAASTLVLIALIAFQVKWLTDSQRLIEEQFDEKVRLALCYAAGNIIVEPTTKCKIASADSPKGCAPLLQEGGCVPYFQDGDEFKVESNTPFVRSTLDSTLAVAFDFYAIDMDYELEIIEEASFSSFGTFPTYQCALNPLQESDNYVMSITFPDKRDYIFGKIKFMFFSSIFILFFITSVFIFANYTLLRQKKMAQINKEFFNNMAHEFRTPLTNISLAGNLLAKKTTDPTHQRYLDIVKEESGKLKHQIERVLHLAKLENGEYQLEKESLCPRKLMQNVIEGMDIQIKEKNANVLFFSNEENIELEGDKFHLGNAFRNLLDNALKYSCATPEIKIRMKKENQGILFQFEDNGIGIGQKEQQGVFEKYRRVQNGDVHDQQGFGLGLAYVKMIVERHQGFIKVISDLNKGTRFDLFLPSKNTS